MLESCDFKDYTRFLGILCRLTRQHKRAGKKSLFPIRERPLSSKPAFQTYPFYSTNLLCSNHKGLSSDWDIKRKETDLVKDTGSSLELGQNQTSHTDIMARPLRIEYDGDLDHATARGNERKRIYFNKTDGKYQKISVSELTYTIDSLTHSVN